MNGKMYPKPKSTTKPSVVHSVDSDDDDEAPYGPISSQSEDDTPSSSERRIAKKSSAPKSTKYSKAPASVSGGSGVPKKKPTLPSSDDHRPSGGTQLHHTVRQIREATTVALRLLMSNDGTCVVNKSVSDFIEKNAKLEGDAAAVLVVEAAVLRLSKDKAKAKSDVTVLTKKHHDATGTLKKLKSILADGKLDLASQKRKLVTALRTNVEMTAKKAVANGARSVVDSSKAKIDKSEL
jgi:hypothetical protein